MDPLNPKLIYSTNEENGCRTRDVARIIFSHHRYLPSDLKHIWRILQMVAKNIIYLAL